MAHVISPETPWSGLSPSKMDSAVLPGSNFTLSPSESKNTSPDDGWSVQRRSIPFDFSAFTVQPKLRHYRPLAVDLDQPQQPTKSLTIKELPL